MENKKADECKVCGCVELNACIHKDGNPCYWAEKNLCSKCKRFPFTTFGKKGGKSKVYYKTEDQMNDTEHDLMYRNMIAVWGNNTRKNRNRFLVELREHLGK